MAAASGIVTFLFTDIEGSTALWQRDAARMRVAVARHHGVARAAVEQHAGRIDTTTGDGVLALFADPLDAVRAALDLQRALGDVEAESGVALRVRCAVHTGPDERDGHVFFGPEANRAARIMNAAHGGQILLSRAAFDLVHHRLPSHVALRDHGLVRLRDLAEPEHVHEVRAAGQDEAFPPLRGLAETPNNLPLQLTPLIGREADIAAVRRALHGNRLVTLTGTGGIGKTRLALEVAALELDRFADGVWFVDLAPVGEASLVQQEVAAALGVKERAGDAMIDTLCAHLSERATLLLLDNCEHLIEACAALCTRLVRDSPRIAVLCTSRESLRVGGEVTYSISPLEVPRVAPTQHVSDLLASDAVRLFVERARRLRPEFTVTPENAPSIAEICRKLDGIPLALELAAARLTSLSPDEISRRLSDRFRLLSKGDRTVLPRQQTMYACIAWSEDLLAPHERQLFHRLSVFAGGWDLSAAAALSSASDQAPLLDTLGALVDKSLVIAEGQRGRYRMLETVRQFAAEALDRSGERQEAHDRHLQHYRTLAMEAMNALGGAGQAEWTARLDVERDNLFAAQSWCDHAADGEVIGLEFAHAVKLYWFKRGLLELGLRFTALALRRFPAGTRSADYSRALFDAGQICSYMGRTVEARRYLEESLSIARELQHANRIAAALQPLGLVAFSQGDLDAADRYFTEAATLARGGQHVRDLAGALSLVGMLRRVKGDLDGAEAYYREAMTLCDGLLDDEGLCVSLVNLAILALERRDVAAGREMLSQALMRADRSGSRQAGQSVIDVVAVLAAMAGDTVRAARLHGAANQLSAESGLLRDEADDAFVTRGMAIARAGLGDAAYATREREGRLLSYEMALNEAHAVVAG